MGNLTKIPHSELTATLEVLARFGVEQEDFDRVRQDRAQAERVAAAFRAGREPAPQVKQVVFRIVRDSRPVEEKVKEGFNYADSNITSQNFRVVPFGSSNPEEAVLVNFGEFVASEKAVERFDKLGLRAGLPTDLADLSKSHPNSKKLAAGLPVVALGDSWVAPDGVRRVVCLLGNAARRGLGLDWWGRRWHDYWWFLAFRK